MGKKKDKKDKKKSKKSDKWESESSEGEFEWIEKKVEEKLPEAVVEAKPQIKGPMMPPKDVNISDLAREQDESVKSANDWLGCGSVDEDNLFSSFGKSLQNGKEKNEERKKMLNDELMRVQSERELNPYLKNNNNNDDGNVDTVAKPLSSTTTSKPNIGDGGLAWWTRALELCKQLAKDQSRSVEAVATERYGSLDVLMGKIKAAQEINDSMKKTTSTFYKPGQMKNRYEGSRSHYNTDDRQRPREERNWKRKDADSERRSTTEYQKPKSYERRRSPSPLKETERKKRKEDDAKKPKRSRTSSSSDSSASSSSSSSDDEPTTSKEEPEKIVIDQKEEETPSTPAVDEFAIKYGSKDVNELGAAIIKAELYGDDELVGKLKTLLDARRNQKSTSNDTRQTSRPNDNQIIIATKTDRFGNEIPLSKAELEQKNEPHSHNRRDKARKKKVKNVYTKEGDRETYFADDNKYSLKDLIEKEKHIDADDNNLMYSTITPKLASKLNSDNMDDDILDNCINKQLDGWSKIKVLSEQRSKTEAMNNCEFCLDNAKKHLIVSLGAKSYLAVPETVSLVEGHCYIVPIQHYISSVMVDEDVWSEMQHFRRQLVEMFKTRNMDCVFVEQFSNEKNFQHMFIECIPITYEASEEAPMYFKKALLEAEKEWATNRPIIDLRGKGVRNGVPKGLPYFSVDFGMEDGFAHIIENKEAFPNYFAKEIIGGIMDLDPYLWRKVKKEKFNEHSKKVIEFLKFWKNFEFNKQQTA